MEKITKHPLFRYSLAYVLLSIIMVYLGIGTPFINVLSGFIIGAYLPAAGEKSVDSRLRTSIKLAGYAILVTWLIMFANWTPALINALDPNFDYVHAGLPKFFSDPKLSYIAWLFLVIMVAPALQFVALIFSAAIRLALYPFKDQQ